MTSPDAGFTGVGEVEVEPPVLLSVLTVQPGESTKVHLLLNTLKHVSFVIN